MWTKKHWIQICWRIRKKSLWKRLWICQRFWEEKAEQTFVETYCWEASRWNKRGSNVLTLFNEVDQLFLKTPEKESKWRGKNCSLGSWDQNEFERWIYARHQHFHACCERGRSLKNHEESLALLQHLNRRARPSENHPWGVLLFKTSGRD